MIDIENELYTILHNRLRSEFGDNIFITGEPMKQTIKMSPIVTIEEMDNSTYLPSMTNRENHSEVTYEINVYSNKANGRKQECKKVQRIIDDELLSRGFIRLTKRPLENFNDNSFYRIVSRYNGVVDEEHCVYRR